ncbi:MAG: hypothetical protein COV07_00770 [Candidatus Vogelbacteria bacterium CG10_big_fil_rev_8_21_14_0_10_45_14]|uniref:Methyltransferase domain-containing protein n=1 Tax=Candidatus Vogelbacteria bacterium CG10_big_fil_rev_8_21_14_0_10_45_14 TaxID=1975042 RepID=A0A2H0RKW4_9BACT|nr:MAG: hypothetical protein COV07_00770 [Candidatus Vogelbacteria bacterium CG10_big_fil_rev_8_21_14_0_10_45_14]
MREYYGKRVKDFFETKGKYFLVKPAIMRALPKSEKGHRLLDVGCGTGVLYDAVAKKGFKYYGIDASEEMLKRAGLEHPHGGYIVARGDKFAHFLRGSLTLL